VAYRPDAIGKDREINNEAAASAPMAWLSSDHVGTPTLHANNREIVGNSVFFAVRAKGFI
jgi:hypothetical protein